MHQSTPSPFSHVSHNNANLKTGARSCYYSSICSYCRDSCYPGRNATFNFVLVLWWERLNSFWLDAFIGPFQPLGIVLVFELPVKQPITRVDLGSTCAWRKWRYALFVFRVVFCLWAMSLKYDVLIIDFRKLKLLIPYMNQQLHLAKLFSLRCSRNFRSFRYESGLYPKCHTWRRGLSMLRS